MKHRRMTTRPRRVLAAGATFALALGALSAAASASAAGASPLETTSLTTSTVTSVLGGPLLEARDSPKWAGYVATGGKKHLKQQTISNLETSLDPARFLRIHRSYIVNLERVAKVEPYGKDTHVAVLSTGAQIPVSRAGYARLKEFLDR